MDYLAQFDPVCELRCPARISGDGNDFQVLVLSGLEQKLRVYSSFLLSTTCTFFFPTHLVPASLHPHLNSNTLTNQPRSPESKRPHPRETSLPSSAASHSLVIRWRPPPTATKNGVHNSQKKSSTNISRTGSFHSLVPQCGFVCASRDSHPSLILP